MEKPPKDTNRFQGNSPAVQGAAKQMRHEMTPAERSLWCALRDKRLGGLRFRAQHPVGQFILDFYCPEHKLVVEVDGGSHEGQEERDSERTRWLSYYGYRVLRFTNDDVRFRLNEVLKRIQEAAGETPTGEPP